MWSGLSESACRDAGKTGGSPASVGCRRKKTIANHTAPVTNPVASAQRTICSIVPRPGENWWLEGGGHCCRVPSVRMFNTESALVVA